MDPVVNSLDAILRAVAGIPLMVLGIGAAIAVVLVVGSLVALKIWLVCTRRHS